MLPLAADESLNGHIVHALRRREPAIDLVTVYEAGLGVRLDPEVLEWAASEGRVLIAQDKKTLIGHACRASGWWGDARETLPSPVCASWL